MIATTSKAESDMFEFLKIDPLAISSSVTHSVLRRAASATCATSEQLETLPLAGDKPVGAITIRKVRERLVKEKVPRFDELINELYNPDVAQLPPPVPVVSQLPDHLVDKLIAAGQLERVDPQRDGPAAAYARSFFVAETKHDIETDTYKERLRWIVHTQTLNKYHDARGYRANVDLRHVSKYLDIAFAPAAATVDLQSSFF